MASKGQRRGTVPAALHQTKPAISVEEWESKAPLGEIEIRSVNNMKAAMEKVPFPLKFSGEDEDSSSSLSVTPLNAFSSNTLSNSPPTTPSHAPSDSTRVRELHPKQPVHSTQQLYDWFALIDRSVAHSQEAHYRAHVANVSEHLETCDLLLSRIDEIDKQVDSMLEGWRSVEEGGKSLKDACERLLEERDRLLELTEDIGSYLEYFQELDHATRMLNYPGEALVFQSDFLYMVERVDICIDFLRSRRHFKEAEVYLLRFQQCMTRAMTLIKMNFVGSLRALSADVSKRLAEKDVSPTAQMHLLYTRFKTVSTKVAPLLGELERRAQAHPDELSALLSECHAAYFSARKALLVPKVLVEIKGLDPSRSELVELTRAGCSYLKQLCTDEFNLYREFFTTAEDRLYQYLETLCDLLYDDLRPRILHEPRLTALCEVCTVLQALMVLDAPITSDYPSPSSINDDDGDPSATEDLNEHSDSEPDDDLLNLDLDRSKSKSKNKVGHRLHTRHLLQMVLQDAQTRLFFKAQSVIQSDIRYYTPKKEDMAWPDMLVAANKPKTGNEIREKETVSRIFKASLAQQDTWYPTVKKMVWVLSQLHDFVQPAIFEDIAQEAALLCQQSLLTAAELIKNRPPPSTAVDGALFLVRHLLILKEIGRSLESEREDVRTSNSEKLGAGGRAGLGPGSAKEFDYGGGGVTGTLTTMLNRTTSILPEGLFASLGVTRSDEAVRGIKHGLDQDLRKSCEEAIASCVNPICQPLDSWITQVHTYSQGTSGSSSSLPASSLPLSTAAGPRTSTGVTADPTSITNWTTPAYITSLYTVFLTACERDLRANVARVRLYLGDEEEGRTARVLIEHVRERVAEMYRAFLESVGEVAKGWDDGGDGGGREEARRMKEGMLSEMRFTEMLREVCGLTGGSSSGYSVGR